jgi:diaminopimelate decarboxylase
VTPPPSVTAALAALPRPVCAYVYDVDTLRRTVAEMRAALPPGAQLLYAVKANGHPDVVAALARHVDGLEVASGGELSLAVKAGASTIAFGGPAKTDDELLAAVATGTLVHVESLLELRRLALVAGDTPVRVALRVNRAGAGLAGSHRMTGVPTPFGIDEATLGAAVALARELPALRLVGFHLHAVSNNLDAAAHAAYVADALAWSVAAARRLRMPLEHVNVGGGFGVDYTGDKRFDLDALRVGLAAVPLPPGVTLAFEPGRFLVAAAGWYAAEVLDLKRTHGRWFAVLRGGTHHFRLPAAWGYSHPAAVLPVDTWPYPFPRPEVRDETVDVVGELCTPRDVLARDLRVDRLRVGDVMVFANAGGYGWDISHHDFLRHPYPRLVVVGQ